MKYAILALGLLVTPAAAETYDRDNCAWIETLLDNCTVPALWAGEGGPCAPTTTGREREKNAGSFDRRAPRLG
jgi:hypothetical protein